jgi:hypothetical protein
MVFHAAESESQLIQRNKLTVFEELFDDRVCSCVIVWV